MHKTKEKQNMQLSYSTYREAWNKNAFAPLFLKVSSDSRLYNTFNDLESALEIQKYVILAAVITCATSPSPWSLLCVSHVPMFPPKRASSALFALEFHVFWRWGTLWLQILKPCTFAKHIANFLFITIYS